MNNAREFFVAQHKVAEENTARYVKVFAEQEKKTVLSALAEFCKGEADLSSVVFEDGVVIFPDGLRFSFYFDDYGASGFRVQGQCPHCGETCWSEPCFTPDRVGEMLVAFEPQDHRCSVPDERRPIAVGDDVTVELLMGIEIEYLEGARVLAIPHDSGGCWQFGHGGDVYAVGMGSRFLLIRKGQLLEGEMPF